MVFLQRHIHCRIAFPSPLHPHTHHHAQQLRVIIRVHVKTYHFTRGVIVPLVFQVGRYPGLLGGHQVLVIIAPLFQQRLPAPLFQQAVQVRLTTEKAHLVYLSTQRGFQIIAHRHPVIALMNRVHSHRRVEASFCLHQGLQLLGSLLGRHRVIHHRRFSLVTPEVGPSARIVRVGSAIQPQPHRHKQETLVGLLIEKLACPAQCAFHLRCHLTAVGHGGIQLVMLQQFSSFRQIFPYAARTHNQCSRNHSQKPFQQTMLIHSSIIYFFYE